MLAADERVLDAAQAMYELQMERMNLSRLLAERTAQIDSLTSAIASIDSANAAWNRSGYY